MNENTKLRGAKISFIGGGNMAAALLGGLVRGGWPAEAFAVAEPRAEQRRELTRRFGVACFEDNAECAARADAVVFAVKPQALREAAHSVADALRRGKPLLISIAAGIRCDDLLRWAGDDFALVRAMPNTPALVGAGITGLFANAQASAAQRELAQEVLRAAGGTLWVAREELMDAVTAVSGSGPAYFFKMMEVMAESAAAHGLAREDAGELAVQTALGAAMLAREQSGDPAELRRQVTSPGGTTEAALLAMENGGFERALRGGMDAARARAAEIADELGAA
ncbi:MAG: Pyrroline-5-carboxylate reductase [Arenicellales bacterium IbO2]|nr:pyrroline-5-carboxylate reductase [Gammaproteobacteria bacterium]MDA7994841.1 pyrroline-5-carboxylate reductase [Gammaproteobacteria bacterium]MDA8023427.1 pyrroline-5-carboxylate reductase [Gammaproteobacteria bacterium]CAJ2377396.1 MAG: Pyrroline-5-carboxylate reductase [Arenicellales bacterium IbO2]